MDYETGKFLVGGKGQLTPHRTAAAEKHVQMDY
jgi:hypothetical protein